MMSGVMTAPGVAHLNIFAVNMVWVVLLGWLTRGLVMRIVGWAYLILAGFMAVTAATNPVGGAGYVVAGVALAMIGSPVWLGGHMLYARAHGGYKSLLARSIVRRTTGALLRLADRHGHRTGQVAS